MTSKSPPPDSPDENKHTDSGRGSHSNRGLRNVMMMGLVSFFTDFSTEMVLGVLPIFVVKDLGASKAILGAMEGSAELTSYVLRMISGSLSDKIGKRKIFVLIGYALSTVSKPFFALSSGWFDAFIVRVADRMDTNASVVANVLGMFVIIAVAPMDKTETSPKIMAIVVKVFIA